MTILRPIFGLGVAQRRLGAEVPELHQKFPLLLGAPVVPKAQIWSSKNICLGPPPPLNDLKKKVHFFDFWQKLFLKKSKKLERSVAVCLFLIFEYREI